MHILRNRFDKYILDWMRSESVDHRWLTILHFVASVRMAEASHKLININCLCKLEKKRLRHTHIADERILLRSWRGQCLVDDWKWPFGSFVEIRYFHGKPRWIVAVNPLTHFNFIDACHFLLHIRYNNNSKVTWFWCIRHDMLVSLQITTHKRASTHQHNTYAHIGLPRGRFAIWHKRVHCPSEMNIKRKKEKKNWNYINIHLQHIAKWPLKWLKIQF